MWRLRWPALLALTLALPLVLGTMRVAAHPMGNFSINHYTAITTAGARLQVLYIIDMAEIPTFQELNSLSARTGISDLAADPSRRLPRAARTSYLASMAQTLVRGLHVSASGTPLRLRLTADDLRFLPGAGGLPTERFYLALDAPLPRAATRIAYADTNYPDRAGWKEIIATASNGAALLTSDVPGQDRSRALTVYPTGAISSPPQVLTAALTLRPGRQTGTAARTWAMVAIWAAEAGSRTPTESPRTDTAQPWAQQRIDALTNLIAARNLTGSVLLLSLLVAFTLGAFHALSPGHGKTMVAAYLVGSRGTARQAVLLGFTVTVTHTIGVFALGLVTLFLGNFIVPDRLYPYLGAASGLLIAAMGGGLLYHRLGTLRKPPANVVPLPILDQHAKEDPSDVRIRA